MAKTEISWTEETWNPVRGCQRLSPGCGGGVTGPGGERGGCYAETMAARIVRMGGYEWIDGGWHEDPKKKTTPTARATADKYRDLVRIGKSGGARWTGRFAFDVDKLSEPLRRKAPTMYFVNSMSDLFGEGLANEQIAAVFGVMAACPQHTFQVLTKRAGRMLEWFKWAAALPRPPYTNLVDLDATLAAFVALSLASCGGSPLPPSDASWPLPNVWLGVSCERQEEADERIPFLLRCPAAIRWVSAEPLLGPVNLSDYMDRGYESGGPQGWIDLPGLDWIVWGGESGHGARPCDVEWIRDGVRQCRKAGIPAFVKQMGAYVTWDGFAPAGGFDTRRGFRIDMKDRKGANPVEWPADLRVREWPRGFTPPPAAQKRLPVVGAS